MTSLAPKRPPGRPRKDPAGTDHGKNRTFRIQGNLDGELKKAAEAANRSVSEEIQYRLMHSLDVDKVVKGPYVNLRRALEYALALAPNADDPDEAVRVAVILIAEGFLRGGISRDKLKMIRDFGNAPYGIKLAEAVLRANSLWHLD